MRFEFIEAHRDEFPVWLMSKVLGVSTSGYYARRHRPLSAREMANQTLWQAIETVYEESKGTYGSPRIYRVVRKTIPCSENRVARLMRKRGLQARQSRCPLHARLGFALLEQLPLLLSRPQITAQDHLPLRFRLHEQGCHMLAVSRVVIAPNLARDTDEE